jgi:glutamate/tyrosine decarboxylase-like PLP-dependent enzyme
MGVHAAYLIQDERPDPFSTVPEFSRRARGFTVWAALRSLGRRGVAEMVERFCAHARRFAVGLSEMEGYVWSMTWFSPRCASHSVPMR